MKRGAAAVALVLACVTPVTQAWVFRGSGGEAFVVDAKTGQGIEGVIVEASWAITNYRDPSGAPLAELAHAETITQAGGKFSLPAWGPVSISLHSFVRSVVKEFKYSEPQLHFYKPGYRLLVENGPTEDARSFWERLHWTGEEKREPWWEQRAFRLEADLSFQELQTRELALSIAALADCKWARMPRITAAYIAEARRLEEPSSRELQDSVTKLLQENCQGASRRLSFYLD